MIQIKPVPADLLRKWNGILAARGLNTERGRLPKPRVKLTPAQIARHHKLQDAKAALERSKQRPIISLDDLD